MPWHAPERVPIGLTTWTSSGIGLIDKDDGVPFQMEAGRFARQV
jgi:hypothetical protein